MCILKMGFAEELIRFFLFKALNGFRRIIDVCCGGGGGIGGILAEWPRRDFGAASRDVVLERGSLLLRSYKGCVCLISSETNVSRQIH